VIFKQDVECDKPTGGDDCHGWEMLSALLQLFRESIFERFSIEADFGILDGSRLKPNGQVKVSFHVVVR
jgi:hypothetical protein